MVANSPIRLHRSFWDILHPLSDAACIYFAMWLVKMLARGYMEPAAHMTAITAVGLYLVAAQLTGVHRRWNALSSNQEVLSIVITWSLTVVGLALVGFATRYTELFARSVMVTWVVLTPALIALVRMLQTLLRGSLLRHGMGVRRVAIAGYNPLGFQIADNIRNQANLGLTLDGFYDDRGRLRSDGVEATQETIAGNLRDLVDRAESHAFDIVMITLPMRAESRIRFVLDQLSNSTASVYIVPDFFVFELLHSRWTSIGGLPAVSVFENPLYGVDGVLKRALDVVLSLAGLIVVAVPMCFIALAIKCTSKGPVFFRQRRYGLDGQEIRVWKFRSMRVCEDGNAFTQAQKNDPRVTAVGAVLRRTSLDELPQLFNVLEGSMSLVGPRPHATAQNEQYRRRIRGYMLRHKVKPGITGLAQVSGCRGETETLDKMQRRIEFDHRYIRQWSVWLDLKILFKTLWVAWRQPEAY